jgi:hypothetical protein
MINGKRKGSTEENKQAKILSEWMFNGDRNVLNRHQTSGAIKSIFVGDIVLQKPIGWTCFPFIIEVKTGYDAFSPTFFNYKIIEEWYTLCRLDGEKTKQNIIIMMCRFKNKKQLFITDQKLPFTHIIYNLSIPIKFKTHFELAYVYYWDDLKNLSFKEVFNTVNINGETVFFEDLIKS